MIACEGISMKKILIGVLLIISIIFSGCITNGLFTLNDSDTIKIGFIGTLSGDAASIGLESQMAYKLAVNNINANGGISGKKLELIYEDGKCNPQDAVNAANKLINIDNVKIILGGFCSSETLAVSSIIEKSKVILFSSSSSSPDVTYAGDYVFRDYPSDVFQGEYLANLAIDSNYNVVGIISEDKDYPQGIAKAFTKKFEDLNGIVYNEKYLSGDKDFKTQITNILSKKPNVLYLLTNGGSTTIMLLKQLREFDYNVLIYTNEQINSDKLINENKELLEGAIFVDPSVDYNSLLINKFYFDWNNSYNQQPEYLPQIYLFTAYDSVYIIKDAIVTCGDINTDCIKNYLYNLKGWQGLSGKITMDDYGDSVWLNYNVNQIRNGKVVKINN